ncbi:MAG: hypothetical protein ACHQXK_08755 [Methanosarcina thermophila]|uniref:Uncharacterized protein n=1 Tax=Methanosarcina thermophila TaxID=2210 RepID=A0A1I6Z8X2_METTE|nr:hypothetical protein [Methanosarcina thermophila]ALK06442.1 MAG: hypothetical protein AAY43_13140 [Methanosarcina sp. 795]NLU55901.1 hypothetical protein [Methanosarcina thermophila]SFT59103.1 hypothetical protein SAMN02910340_01379 [Methanosarcina thermophila]BAW29540.1 conserved hypothetical protein [Methanosarcina thermophila]GLI14040.1 hypothetical protein MTHERMMSTA1_11660 [Methanosarcina thermophila MST-A1]
MGHYIVRIHTDTWDRLRDLQSLYDLDVFGKTAKQLVDGSFEVQGILSEKRIRILSEKGYRIEILNDVEKVAKERLKDVANPGSLNGDQSDK